MHFSGRSNEWRDPVREGELHATADAIRAYADSLQGFAGTPTVCVFGAREAIEASTVEFEQVVELIG